MKRTPSAEEIDSEIARIRSLDKDQLKESWRETFKRDVPKALTKDLLARMLIYRMQEQIFGGLDRAALKILESYANGKPSESDRLRRLKPGTVLVREYQGERHTVTISPEGFIWQERTYDSLSAIALSITGTKWNGHRFFGVTERQQKRAEAQAAKLRDEEAKGPDDEAAARGRRAPQ
jgi:hypothetical protein